MEKRKNVTQTILVGFVVVPNRMSLVVGFCGPQPPIIVDVIIVDDKLGIRKIKYNGTIFYT